MINKYGLYVQADGGNGDSAHRTGLAFAISSILQRFYSPDKEIVSLEGVGLYSYVAIKIHLEVDENGTFIRHPAEYDGDWSARPDTFSRDQASRIILGMAVLGDTSTIKKWLKQMAKRFFFHQNNYDPTAKKWRPRDIMAPGEWRNVIRGLNLWYLYPILLILDLLFIPDIYLRSKWDGASLYVPDLKFALIKYWTPCAWLANKLNNRTKWYDEVMHNHSLEKNGCVELQELFTLLKEVN